MDLGEMGGCCDRDKDKEEDEEKEQDEEESSRIMEVKKVLRNIRSCNHLDLAMASASEVYPRLYIGNRLAASNQEVLDRLGITHLLNAAHPGPDNCMTVDCSNINTHRISYLGLQLSDENEEDIRCKFLEAGEWIQEALTTEENRVMVNCWAGISRSSTLVIAFLMAHREMSLPEAVRQVKLARDIAPNRGFIQQLVRYETELGRAK